MDDQHRSVQEFVDQVSPQKRRRDAHRLLALMGRVTGAEPRLSGTIIGFGHYHYKYESGREGDGPAAAFSPRKAATVIYLSDGVGSHEERLSQLGPHSTGVGCVYIPDMDKIDISALEMIIAESYRTLTDGTYTNRARKGRRNSTG
jgi:hypothetical protein